MDPILFSIVSMVLSLFSSSVDSGGLSVYWPGDGWNGGELCCGGKFTKEQDHIAYRGWPRIGCGGKVVVCSVVTQRCTLTHVRDAGPFGIYRGPLTNAYAEGRWRVFTGPGRPPKGWRYRAVADLTRPVWRALGRPPGLSPVRLYFLRATTVRAFYAWWQGLEEAFRHRAEPVL